MQNKINIPEFNCSADSIMPILYKKIYEFENFVKDENSKSKFNKKALSLNVIKINDNRFSFRYDFYINKIYVYENYKKEIILTFDGELELYNCKTETFISEEEYNNELFTLENIKEIVNRDTLFLFRINEIIKEIKTQVKMLLNYNGEL